MAQHRRAGRGADVDGYVVVDKQPGWTSHDVVGRCRRVFGQRSVGHAGTLDPAATGALVVGLGSATRLLRFASALGKSYVGELVLGAETSTLDAEGVVLARFDMSGVTLEDVSREALALTGRIMQVPPMVSAVKIDGRRLHELARQGVEVERPARPVTVTRFDIEARDEPGAFGFAVECSSGTYVRVLAEDLGRALGGGAYMRSLRRTAVGSFLADGAPLVGELTPDSYGSVADLVRDYPSVVASEETALGISHGRSYDRGELLVSGDGPWAVLDEQGELLAMYEARGAERAKPAVVMPPPRRRGRPGPPPVVSGAAAQRSAARRRNGSAVTIGAFDGVHLGHRRLISELRRRAEARDLRTVVVTFDRHPASVVRPDSAPRLLTDLEQKLELLTAEGVDEVVVVRFDEERASEPADDFVRRVLVGDLSARLVIVGSDFHFGRARSGNVALLERMGAELGFSVIGYSLVASLDAEAISSTRIRSLLAVGDVEGAAALLGRSPVVRAEVVRAEVERSPDANGAGSPGNWAAGSAGVVTASVPRAVALPGPGAYRVEVKPDRRPGQPAVPAVVCLAEVTGSTTFELFPAPGGVTLDGTVRAPLFPRTEVDAWGASSLRVRFVARAELPAVPEQAISERT